MASKLKTILAVTAFAAGICAFAQSNNDPFNSGRRSMGARGNDFNSSRVGNFNDYRTKLNAEYARIVRQPWGQFNKQRGQEDPEQREKPVPPVVIDENKAKGERNDRQITIEEVVRPRRDNNGAQPIAPVRDNPDAQVRNLTFSYLGTQAQVRVPSNVSVRLGGTGENAVADGWDKLASDDFAPLVADCMKLKTKMKLCDWAYLNMLKAMADAYVGAGTNESTLVTAFLFSQSGYRIRMATDGSRLELLYASQHSIYDKPYFSLDGEKFYTLSKNVGNNMRVCAAKFPKEKSLSLWVQSNPEVAESLSPARTITSKRYPDFSFRVSVNRNLIPFYDSYPTSEVGGNFMTRWAMYANTPVCASVRNNLYPALKSKTAGMSQLEAAERILNWVQTGMVYEYDDKVWGHDRAFFANESLYYPYCDCEDRSILFTRIMRDLYGLKCILIYYPGHLACAVNFPGGAKGDYIMVNGVKYTVCDPTYIGAPVGMTMDGMDNATAKVITLD